jgi:RNA recognition motif-containing protein
MTKLFVVGFPREMNEIDLDQLFTLHALVSKITIIRDQQTGVSKAYAFVEMMDAQGADRAIKALNGMTFGQRVMSVRHAEKKTQDEQHTHDRSYPSSRHVSQNNAPKRAGDSSPYNRPRRPNKVN